MTTLPSFDPLATAAPLSSTIVVVDAQILLAVAVALVALAVSLCVGALRARPLATGRRGLASGIAVPFAAARRTS